MKKYEVLFRVESSGFSVSEVSERAGEIFDGTRMEPKGVMTFMWTRLKKDRALMYESMVSITNNAMDHLEASEKAGAAVDISRMTPSMVVSLVGVRGIRSCAEYKMGGLICRREKTAPR